MSGEERHLLLLKLQLLNEPVIVLLANGEESLPKLLLPLIN